MFPKFLNNKCIFEVFALMLVENTKFKGKKKLDKQSMKYILFPTVYTFMSKTVKNPAKEK